MSAFHSGGEQHETTATSLVHSLGDENKKKQQQQKNENILEFQPVVGESGRAE